MKYKMDSLLSTSSKTGDEDACENWSKILPKYISILFANIMIPKGGEDLTKKCLRFFYL